MTKIEVYTDGSATVPSKPGGWAWVMVIDGAKYSKDSGYSPSASNNDMELEAAIQGLRAVSDYILNVTDMMEVSKSEFDVTLCSDSQLILGWANGSFKFKQEAKMDKFHKLSKLVTYLNAKTRWIKGHSGDIYNEQCDKLANQARKQILIPASVESGPTLTTKIGSKKTGVVSLWYGNQLKIIDLENNIVEVYNRDLHGKRGSAIEIREEKDR